MSDYTGSHAILHLYREYFTCPVGSIPALEQYSPVLHRNKICLFHSDTRNKGFYTEGLHFF